MHMKTRFDCEELAEALFVEQSAVKRILAESGEDVCLTAFGVLQHWKRRGGATGLMLYEILKGSREESFQSLAKHFRILLLGKGEFGSLKTSECSLYKSCTMKLI